MSQDISSTRRTAHDESVRFLVEAGYMALCLGDPSRARAIFKGVCEVIPEHHSGHLGLAEALLDLGQAADAFAVAGQAVRADGHAPGTLAWALLVQGKAALAREDRKTARVLYEQAREVDPGGPGAVLAANWMATIDDVSGTRAAIVSLASGAAPNRGVLQ